MDEFGIPSPFADINGMGIDYREMNKGITPRFFIERLEDKSESEKAGRPIYKEYERIHILVAADPFNTAAHPVDDTIKERFTEAYEKFKKGRVEVHVDGTPITEWPAISATFAMELRAIGIYSVEHMRDIADTNVNRIPDGRIWREKAKAWLETAKDSAASMRFAAENERLRDDIAAMQKTIAELSARVDQGADEVRRGPGRPPRAAA